jgi:hypothetical protein
MSTTMAAVFKVCTAVSPLPGTCSQVGFCMGSLFHSEIPRSTTSPILRVLEHHSVLNQIWKRGRIAQRPFQATPPCGNEELLFAGPNQKWGVALAGSHCFICRGAFA